MQLQNLSPEPRRDRMLERIESRTATPKDTAREMMREGDREITDAKSGIENVRTELKSSSDPGVTEQLKAMEADLDAAWGELNSDIRTAAAPEASGIYEKPAVPTKEELDWEIPEEAMAPTERAPALAPKEAVPIDEENAGELMREALANALEGKGDAAHLKRLLDTEKGRWEAEDRIDAIMRDAAADETTPFKTLDGLSSLASQESFFKERIVSSLAERIGPKFAEKLLSDAEYRKGLQELQEALGGTLSGPESPRLCGETSLDKLIGIRETLGESAVAITKTLDLRGYGKGLDKQLGFQRGPEGKVNDAIRVLDVEFDESGELVRSQIDIGMNYAALSETGEPNGEFAQIHRSFMKKMQKQPDGSMAPELTVKHELFELPPSIKGGGVAAEVTRRSLAEYDKMGADAIALHADIEQGGYAWASYGYGWDFEEMSPSDIEGTIRSAKNSILSALEEAGVPLDEKIRKEIVDPLEEAEKNPLASTPQLLARIGKDGPVLRKGESGTWYTEENYQKAIAEGRETGELAMMKGSLHAGKVGLIGNDWWGKIELKAGGAQGGKNRKLLEEKITPKK